MTIENEVCVSCREPAYEFCHDCGDPVCEDHIAPIPGYTMLQACARCVVIRQQETAKLQREKAA